jgi:hypothetical protein
MADLEGTSVGPLKSEVGALRGLGFAALGQDLVFPRAAPAARTTSTIFEARTTLANGHSGYRSVVLPTSPLGTVTTGD